MSVPRFRVVDAYTLAARAHAGQVDQAGVPYVRHVTRVADMVALAGGSPDMVSAAVLHDIVEDVYGGDVTPLRDAGVPEAVIAMIVAVTRGADPSRKSGKEPYLSGLIVRAARHDGARVIKLMDNAHNSLPWRVAVLGERGKALSMTRYAPARAVLLRVERASRASGGPVYGFPADPAGFMAWAVAVNAVLDLGR